MFFFSHSLSFFTHHEMGSIKIKIKAATTTNNNNKKSLIYQIAKIPLLLMNIFFFWYCCCLLPYYWLRKSKKYLMMMMMRCRKEKVSERKIKRVTIHIKQNGCEFLFHISFFLSSCCWFLLLVCMCVLTQTDVCCATDI